MSEKLKNIFEKLNINIELDGELTNADIKDLNINEEKNSVSVTIKNDTNLSLYLYLSILGKLEDYFPEAKVKLIIVTDSPNEEHLNDYYMYAIEKFENEKNALANFRNRIIIEDEYSILAMNAVEERQIKGCLTNINKILSNAGYSKRSC